MADVRTSIRLQREILRSLGFACVEEEPDFSAFVGDADSMATAPGPSGLPVAQRIHPPRPASPNIPTRDRRPSTALSRDALRSEADRDRELSSIVAEVEGCTRCGLHVMRKRAVAGEGSGSARLFVIGEAPSEDDDQAGAPFRGGELGELMTNILKAIGFARDEVFITHAAKCRPPRGRAPGDAELECCHNYLARQVEAIHPEVIVCFGQAALQSLVADGEDRTLSKCRGRWLDYRGIAVMPTFSLPYIVRNRDRKKVVWEDLQEVMRRLARQ
ncbi:uracil-DNA glycosylase [Candidatus Sumerlaeota bacterium]|nr:uracil-DNA glycosylase [Candidatus Sumerlaeota bacterium]